MSEGELSYGSFIHEAFIVPIRTVIVVDDEFPALDALIGKELNHVKKTSWQQKDLERVRDIIRFCREDKRKWMVEINDGQFDPTLGVDKAIPHLHQSDLLILDYHLDSDNPNDGARAIEILRHLACNNHFNLVVVYTKGYEDVGGKIEEVVREIAIGLSQPHPKMNMPQRALDSASNIVEKWEDDNPDIGDQIKELIDNAAYLKVRNLCADISELNSAFGLPELQEFTRLMDGILPEPNPRQRNQILRWALHYRQQMLLPRLSPSATDEVRFEWESDGTNWIRTERLFVTVVGKTSNEPEVLPEKLAAALEKWNPEPHRLLMSYMRAELDENGVLAEAEVLGNRYLQAGWLEEFLTEDQLARTWKIRNTVARHWESLGDDIQKRANKFSEQLAEYLLKQGKAEAIERHIPKLHEDRTHIALHMNRYVCSKPPEGHHLTTGHVLRTKIDNQEFYWICLSPACDLVPGQKKTGWSGRLKGYLAFMAVELFFVKESQAALASAFSGNHLFLEIDGDISCFSFTPLPPNNKSKGDEEKSKDVADHLEDRVANPKWEQMFAENQGRFESSRNLNIRRIEGDENGSLRVSSVEAQIVAQLRYEYALNLLNRLGANLSRVGLDFTQLS
jgi:hypothetical protein